MNDKAQTLYVYDTLSAQKKKFEPISGNEVRLFVCGPTVYDFPHLGHAKTYTQFDFIVRYLRFKGYNVFYLQNITDIDDKIIQRARERGISWKELALEFEKIYLDDMVSLHNTSVSKYARATDYIDQIVKQVKVLLDKGIGYYTPDGSVYYELSKFPEYGKLSKRTELRENDAVSRIDENRDKRGKNDFCLWKAPKPGEPFWETDIGPGRPGWHIEDTAITEAHFGPQYDVHGGAIDLIFPHHEAEIAQMEAISGKKPLVRYWLHTGFLNINKSKMSKSKGNFYTIREALEITSYRVLRYLFISSHYRTTFEFSDDVLRQAKGAIRRLDEFVFNIDREYDDVEHDEAVKEIRKEILKWLDDDFNTPRAFSALFDFIRSQNTKRNLGKRHYQLIRDLNEIFDIFNLKSDVIDDTAIMDLISKRERYRASKDFVKADEIRDQLLRMGIKLYDTNEGVKWRKEDDL